MLFNLCGTNVERKLCEKLCVNKCYIPWCFRCDLKCGKKMPMNCFVFKCGNTSEKNPELSFHEFPSNKKFKKAREDRIRREEFEPSSYSHVCSKHFLESDDAKPNLDTPVDFQKKRLKRGIIPSVNLRGSGVDEKVSARNSMASKKARMTENISSWKCGR